MKEVIPRNNITMISLLVFVSFFTYANSFKNGFVWDDFDLIVDNDYIKDLRYIPNIFSMTVFGDKTAELNFYRPIQGLSYMVDYSLWKLKPFGYHLTNILLHTFNAILVFFVILSIFFRKDIAFVTSLLFAIHPIQTEAVTYISGRADLLVTLFLLLSFIFLIKYTLQKRRVFYYISSFLFFILALLSKEIALIFPVAAILFIYCLGSKNKKSIVKNHFLISLLILSVYFFLRMQIFNFSDKEVMHNIRGDFFLRFLITGKVMVSYVWLLFFPIGLHMERYVALANSFFEPAVLIPWLLLGLIAVALVKAYRKSKRVFFCISWLFIFLVPVSNVVPLNALMAEHWLYLPGIGFFALAAIGIIKLINHKVIIIKKITIIFFISVVVIYSYLTIKRNTLWRDEIVFYTDTLRYTPDSPRIHNNLGMAYSNKGDYKKAVSEIEKALYLREDYADAHYNLANVYADMGEYDKAIKKYKDALQFAPGHFKTYYNLSKIYADKNMFDESISELERAKIIDSQNVNVYNNLGLLYMEKGEFDLAASALNYALKLKPDYAEVHYNLGNAYNKKGDYPYAIRNFKKAIELKPEFADAHINLGNVYVKQRLYDLAVLEFEEVLKIVPENILAHYNLGLIYTKQKQFEKAQLEFEEVIKIEPNFKDAGLILEELNGG